jgi:hypothetical protein
VNGHESTRIQISANPGAFGMAVNRLLVLFPIRVPRRPFAVHLLLVPVLFAALAAAGAEPTLTHLYPVAGQRGTSFTVAASGKFGPWPPQTWADTSGIQFTATPITGVFNVDLAANVAPGPHLVRLFNEQGASAPRFLIVTRTPELRDTERNDELKGAQPIRTLPASIGGRLDKAGDVDGFAVCLKQGETLVAWVDAYVLGSSCDAFLRIVDPQGQVHAFNHDRQNPDPFLAWTPPRDGTFIVQVMAFAYPANSSVRLAGGEGCIYRLQLRSGPIVRFTLPLALPGGINTAVRLIGWNLPASTIELAPPSVHCGSMPLDFPGLELLQPVPVSGLAETIEEEPNDTTALPPGDVPFAITGQIHAPGDEDRFGFTARRKHVYDLKVTGARAGSSLDAWLKIEDAEGKELARNDDAAGSRDPQLTWTAPADGIFTIALGDLTHRGGPDFLYRIAITEAEPSVTGTAAAHSITVQRGKTAELKVTVKRAHGYSRKLEIAPGPLPAGVSASPVEVPAKDGEIALKFVAESHAGPSAQPCIVVLREVETGEERPVRFPLIATSEDNGVPQGYAELIVNATEQLWITVPPEPPK